MKLEGRILANVAVCVGGASGRGVSELHSHVWAAVNHTGPTSMRTQSLV